MSANQRLLWPLAAMLDDRSEQKVTTLDKDLTRNISAKYGSTCTCVRGLRIQLTALVSKGQESSLFFFWSYAF
jgi:hypothetical protein